MATDWIILNKTGGTHNDEVTVTPQPNYGSNSRSVNIIISTSEKSKAVTVYQEGYEMPTNQITYFAPNRLSERAWTGSTSGFCFSPAVLTNHTFSDGVGVLTFDRDVTKLGQYTFVESDASTITGLILPKTALDWEFDLERLQIDTIIFQGTKNEAFENLKYYMTSTSPYAFSWKYLYDAGIRYIECDDGIIDIAEETNSLTYYGTSKLSECWQYTNNESKIEMCSFVPNTKVVMTGIYHDEPTYPEHTFENGVGTIVFYPKLRTFGNFCRCTNLTGIIIPSTVEHVNRCAFSGCTGLSSVTFENNIEVIPCGLFQLCSALTAFTIPNTVKMIGDNLYLDLYDDYYEYNQYDIVGAFQGSGLRSIVIPNSVEYICRNSFSGIRTLSSLTFSNSVKYIGERAFYNDDGLAYDDGIHYNGTRKDWFNIPKTNDSFYRGTNVYCSDKSFKLNEDTGKITYLSSSKLPNLNGTTYNMYSDGFGTMDGNITNSAFIGNSGLTSIMCTIGSGSSIFENCTSLESVALNVDYPYNIGERCFYNCSSLKSIIIPSRVDYIKDSAFENCTSLKNVYFDLLSWHSSYLSEIYNRAFANCSSIEKLSLPSVDIGPYAFDGCINLKEVIIYRNFGAGPTLVFETGCFSGCTSLNHIWFNQPQYIYDDVFSGCINLTQIDFGGTVSEWNNTTKTTNWNRGSSIQKIHCTDGDINL